MNLTARSYALAALTVLLGILGQWSQDIDATLWRIPAAALLILLILEGWHGTRWPLQLERGLPLRAYLGRRFRIRPRLHNAAARPLRFKAADAAPPEVLAPSGVWSGTAPAGSHASTELTLTPISLGRASWGSAYARVLGVFGLAWWPRRLHEPAQVDVAPDHLEGRVRRAGSTAVGELSQPLAGTGVELLGLRDYRPGDPLRAIDWKASARRARTTVKLFSREEHLELTLAVDTGRSSQLQVDALTRLHHYVNVAAKLAERAVLNGDRVTVMGFADAPGRVAGATGGTPALLSIRAALGQLRPSPRESNPLSAALRIRELARHRSLVVFLTDLGEGEAAAQLLRATRLLRPKHLPLVASILDTETERLAWRPPNRWQEPYESLAAMELLRAARATALDLRRLGAHVVLSPAVGIDRRVLGLYQELRQRRSV